MIQYFASDEDSRPRATIILIGAIVRNITVIKDKDFSFSIQTDPPLGKTYLLSTDSLEESEEWRDAIIEAATKS